MTSEPSDRSVDGRFSPSDPPELAFEIRFVDGDEARALCLEQARVLKEVVEWVARQRSERGQSPAA